MAFRRPPRAPRNAGTRWLIAVDHVRRTSPLAEARRRWAAEAQRALGWLLAQEHQRFRLLQQNEASDWADIMPRSGYVLYSNALWCDVKRRFGLPEAQATHDHFNHLFHPVQRDLPEYHRARLLQHYARRGQADRALYLLAVLCGLTDDGPHDCRHRAGVEGGRAVSEPRRAASARAQRRAVAALHGAASAGPPTPVPQRRHVALRRRLLGHGAGAPRPIGRRLAGAAATRRRQRPRRPTLHRMAARPQAGADGHRRTELERGHLPDQAAVNGNRRSPWTKKHLQHQHPQVPEDGRREVAARDRASGRQDARGRQHRRDRQLRRDDDARRRGPAAQRQVRRRDPAAAARLIGARRRAPASAWRWRSAWRAYRSCGRRRTASRRTRRDRRRRRSNRDARSRRSACCP